MACQQKLLFKVSYYIIVIKIKLIDLMIAAKLCSSYSYGQLSGPISNSHFTLSEISHQYFNYNQKKNITPSTYTLIQRHSFYTTRPQLTTLLPYFMRSAHKINHILKSLKNARLTDRISTGVQNISTYLRTTVSKHPKHNIHSENHHRSAFHYQPTAFLSHPFSQIIYNISEPLAKLNYTTQQVFFEDGGHVTLNWALCTRTHKHHKKIQVEEYEPASDAPIFFVMHGLTGGSKQNYVKALINQARAHDFRTVCLNSRGIGIEMTSPIPYTAMDFHELDKCLDIIQERYPNCPIYMVGTSFGANYVTRYLINNSRPSIQGLVALAAPFDVPTVVRNMGPVYQKFFVKRYIKETVKSHPQMQYWQKIGLVNMEQLFKSNNLFQFHGRLTAKIVGLPDAEALFQHYKIGDEIASLSIPTLIMNSKDDPIVTSEGIPYDAIRSNKNIQFHETETGGHVCWYQGMVPKRWYPKPTVQFLKKVHQSNM